MDLPNINLETTSGKTVNLAKLPGKNIVLYFYPKDSTPGCTIESKAFRDLYPEFQAANTEIYGISRDSIKSHEKFKCKHEFPFELISDPNSQLCDAFEVIGKKSFFGKEITGIIRSTFLFDSQGQLQKEWRKVKVKGHVAEVLEAVKSL